MISRIDILAQRRRELLAASAAQRRELALQVRSMQQLLTSMDAGLRITRRVQQHPGWLAVAALGLIALRPRHLSSLLRLGTASLRTWRKLAPTLQYLPLPRD